jgi:hypothetical protein
MKKKIYTKETYNKILLIHSQWMKKNEYDNWKECERASKDRLKLSFADRVKKPNNVNK